MTGVELRRPLEVAPPEVVEGDRGLDETLVEVRVRTLRREPQCLERFVRLLVLAGVEELHALREAARRLKVPMAGIRRASGIGRRSLSGFDQGWGAEPACTGSGAGSGCENTRDCPSGATRTSIGAGPVIP